MNDDTRQLILSRIKNSWPTCSVCNGAIALARLESLPATTECTKHSKATAYFGLMEYAHKTAGQVVINKDGNEETRRRMVRAFKRARDR